jgi:hypothetical protein
MHGAMADSGIGCTVTWPIHTSLCVHVVMQPCANLLEVIRQAENINWHRVRTMTIEATIFRTPESCRMIMKPHIDHLIDRRCLGYR